jgi:hypothetical protein
MSATAGIPMDNRTSAMQVDTMAVLSTAALLVAAMVIKLQDYECSGNWGGYWVVEEEMGKEIFRVIN